MREALRGLPERALIMVTHEVCGTGRVVETEASRPGLTPGVYEAE